MPHTVVIRVAPILLAFSFAAAQSAEGQVPMAADIAACNEEAFRAVKAGTSSPTAEDRARAARARGETSSTPPQYSTTKTVESPDPQIHGMESEGAKNALYQAAYRSCMRRKGF